VAARERQYFADMWHNKDKKKKKASKDRHYAFTVSKHFVFKTKV